MNNPLVDDRLVDLLLREVHPLEKLCTLPHFRDHDVSGMELYLENLRRFARDVLFPTYRRMDAQPPDWKDGQVRVHRDMHELYPRMLELGVVSATRPNAVGGHQLPMTVATAGHAYLMAANVSVCGFFGLTGGAAHLLEAFGDEDIQRKFMDPLYSGRWTGTMALTEPQAGSSLADIATRATPDPTASDPRRFRIVGNKTFISGGDHDITENIVHLTLARIDGAPAGSKGISLFAVPKRREEAGKLVGNDVCVTGLIHKLGWRGLPSTVLSFGESNDCIGYLVGEPHRGLSHMFQMMNEARILVGLNATGTASAAYQEALAYAKTRTQGRPVTERNVSRPQVPIIEHADVRRMLLRQKAIVEGSLALLITTAWYADLAEHDEDERRRRHAKGMLDLLTPIAKNFPAEWGFEATTLALQVHGGYGYSTEYLPECWMRDQKLNTIHEGTTGIQGLDLLGRRAVAEGGASLAALRRDVVTTVDLAARAGLEPAWGHAVLSSLDEAIALTQELGGRGLAGDVDGMLLHGYDYLTMMSIIVVAWQHLEIATAARSSSRQADERWAAGLLESARYWICTELPRTKHLASLCRTAESSYQTMESAWF